MIRYPRMPTGPSAPGAAGVRALQRTGGDWQTKRPLMGVTARQQGEFQRVWVEEAGWVSCGKVERSSLTGLQYITPSWRLAGGVDGVINQRGINRFTDLVLPSPQLQVVAENPIGYIAGGLIHKLEHDGEFLTGSTTTARLSLKSSFLPFGSGRELTRINANSLPHFIPGSLYLGDWYGGIAHDALGTGFSMGYYTGFQIGGDVWTVELPAVSSGSQFPMTRRPIVHRITPDELLAFIPGMQSTSSGPRGSRFASSLDNGRNWVYSYVGSTIMTDRIGYNPGDPDAWSSDAAVLEIRDRLLATFMPDGRGIAVVGEGAYNAARAGLALRIYELGETSTTLLASNIEIAPTQCSTVHQHCGFHQGRPMMQFVEDDTSTHFLGFVTSDATGIDFAPMPRPSHCTGRARALDENTIQCPMWMPADSEARAGYYIMTSEDFGATWSRLHLIKADDTEPAEITVGGFKVNHTLQAFADAFLPRVDGRPAYTYPGAPWVGDLTVIQPWLET